MCVVGVSWPGPGYVGCQEVQLAVVCCWFRRRRTTETEAADSLALYTSSHIGISSHCATPYFVCFRHSTYIVLLSYIAVFKHLHNQLSVQIELHGFKQIPMDSNGFSRIQTDSNGFKRILVDSNEFAWIQTDFWYGFKQLHTDTSFPFETFRKK